MHVLPESPVDIERKELPRGSGKWPGFDAVYLNIERACEVMGRDKYLRLSDEHVQAMAVLGCGHEETMKYEQMRLRSRGFIGERRRLGENVGL